MPDWDDLRGAWDQVQPPPPWRELDAEDAATQEVVAWLRAAWRAVPAPAGAPARARRARPSPILRIRRGAAAGAAAAATLLVAAVGVWALSRAAQPAPAASEFAQGPATQPAQPRARAPVALPAGPPVQILAQTPERLELRSGAVRLTVFRDAPASTPNRQPRPSR